MLRDGRKKRTCSLLVSAIDRSLPVSIPDLHCQILFKTVPQSIKRHQIGAWDESCPGYQGIGVHIYKGRHRECSLPFGSENLDP